MRITKRRKRVRQTEPIRPLPPTERGLRFYQLLALAEEGNEHAVGDLFREFGFRFGKDTP
jgi:hypothetical protein